MPPKFIQRLIKTECGRAKYLELADRSGFLAKIRLVWFIFFAGIKDWNIPESDWIQDSKS